MALPAEGSLLVLTSTYPRWPGDPDPGFVHELSRRLVERGFRVDVLAPRAPGAEDVETLDDVRVYRYGYFLRRFEVLSYGGGILPKLKANPLLFALVPFLLAGLMLAIRSRLRTGEYSAIHAHWIIPQALCACAARGGRKTPILVTSHGGDLFGLRAAPLRFLKSWTLARCERVAVVSRYMQAIVTTEHGVPPERCRVLPMGVDLSSRFSMTTDAQRDVNRLVFVGRLVEKKGVAHLIEAMKILRSRFPEARLDVIGDGPLRPELESRVRNLGLGDAVDFLGALPQEKIPAALRSAALAVVPSVVDRRGDQEGLGLVIVEAMGCGTPVVASDLPAIRDVVEHEHTGLLAVPGDPADLADKLATLMAAPDTAHALAVNAQDFVKQRFDWERVADAYAAELGRL